MHPKAQMINLQQDSKAPIPANATFQEQNPIRAKTGGKAIIREPLVSLWTPSSERVTTTLSEPIARCLSAAFSSGPWAATPMPLGDASDQHSARGIVAGLGQRSLTLVASTGFDGDGRGSVLASVLGCVLDDDLIEQYGLRSYGARAGDALFAYIGLRPSVQGRRVRPMGNDNYSLEWNTEKQAKAKNGSGLASLLFSQWLQLPAVRQCPRVFIRTRRILKPIQALAKRNGFEYCGSFDLEFQGVQQDRMVYRKIS